MFRNVTSEHFELCILTPQVLKLDSFRMPEIII